jgi:type I restriction-modification system DNA methylase subunit
MLLTSHFALKITIAIAMLMVEMLFCHSERDSRTETVADPCAGTGRLLLLASNHSVSLYAQDVYNDKKVVN